MKQQPNFCHLKCEETNAALVSMPAIAQSLSVREVWGSNSSPVKLDTVSATTRQLSDVF